MCFGTRCTLNDDIDIDIDIKSGGRSGLAMRDYTATGGSGSFLTPTSSTSILSSPTGPKDVLTMFARDWAANTGGGAGAGREGEERRMNGRDG